MSSLLSCTRNTRRLLPDSFRYIRSDVPASVTREDIQWLLEHNIRTVVDLRSLEEKERKPCPLEGREGFKYYHLPVTGGNSIPSAPELVHKSYLNMVDGQMERILERIENADSNTLYFCNAGKDRTGVVSALLLMRMGAADADIVRDYVVSGQNLREMLEEYVAANPGVDIRVITPCAAYMEAFLKAYRKMRGYSHPYYQQVCDFLIALNREKKHINWNWARWEWMYSHPYCDREKLHTIGLWLDEDTVVGAAIYDLFHSEAFCGALDGYEHLLPEILEYAYGNLRDENGLGVAVRDDDVAMQEQLARMGYQKTEQTEPILCRNLNEPLDYEIPAEFSIREIRFPEDNLAYQTVIWKGFGHEGDQAELEKMLANKVLPPNRRSELCLAVVDETGEFAAHCTCWYDERTDYAYVEPVCTIPKYRGMGLGKAVVLEALRRCKALGANQAFVISDQEFYKKLGFALHSTYIFFKKSYVKRGTK